MPLEWEGNAGLEILICGTMLHQEVGDGQIQPKEVVFDSSGDNVRDWPSECPSFESFTYLQSRCSIVLLKEQILHPTHIFVNPRESAEST